MIFSTPARSSATVMYMVVLSALALFATMPLTAQADCTLECAAINTKIVFCGNVKNGFQDTMPVIGVDSQLDDCLCTQENVHLYRSCLGCENLDTAANISAKFVSDCKITNPSRVLINGAFSRLDSLPSAGVNVVALIAVIVALSL